MIHGLNAINETKPKQKRPPRLKREKYDALSLFLRVFILLNILIFDSRRLERHVYDPVAPIVHDTQDRT